MSRRGTDDESSDSISDSDDSDKQSRQTKNRKPKRKARHAVFCQNPVTNFGYPQSNQFGQFQHPIGPVVGVPQTIPNPPFVSSQRMPLEVTPMATSLPYGSSTSDSRISSTMHGGVPPLASWNVQIPPMKCDIFPRC